MKASSSLLQQKMISYLGISCSRQLVIEYNMPDLLDLIRLARTAGGLEIHNFLNASSRENVVASLYPFIKTEVLEQTHHICEYDIGVRIATQNLFQKFFGAGNRD